MSELKLLIRRKKVYRPPVFAAQCFVRLEALGVSVHAGLYADFHFGSGHGCGHASQSNIRTLTLKPAELSFELLHQ
jgi:hypothetical protein